MLAVRLHPDGSLRGYDERVPTPAPGEALVRVTAVGLCGSDRHWYLEGGIGETMLEAPLVLGHEFGGVAESGTHRGRRVAVDPAIPCGRCEVCTTGRENLCPDMRFAGHGSTDGGLREYLAWPEAALCALSDGLGRDVEALIEPLGIAVYAAELGGLAEGARVAVLGCGPIGLLLVALAHQAGAREIVVSDPLPHRLEAARETGATSELAVDASAVPGNHQPDIVFEASGEQAAVDQAVAIARPGATIVLVGIPSEDRTSFSASAARRKGLTLRLSRRSTAKAFERAVDLAEAGRIDLGSLVTLRVPLSDAASGFAALADRRGIKVVIEPGS
jgi:L-iditol 2-dehydrogenase